MATELRKDFYRLEVPLPNNPLKYLNSYLFRSRDRNLLVDTGFNREVCRKAILSQLDELHVALDETDIFITHLHSDHSGLGAELVSPGRRIYMGETDAISLNRHLDDDYWVLTEDMFVKAGFPRKDIARVAPVNPAKVDMPKKHYDYACVHDGGTMQIGAYTLKFIETPGHTPGHMCIYLEDERLLLTGDHVLFDITPNISAWPELPNALDSYLHSLKKVSLLDVSYAYASHRTPEGNLLGRVGELLNHHQTRLNNTYDIVKSKPGQNGNEIASQMKWSIRAATWDEFPLAQKWFAIGEAASHLAYLESEGKIKKELSGDYYRYWPA